MQNAGRFVFLTATTVAAIAAALSACVFILSRAEFVAAGPAIVAVTFVTTFGGVFLFWYFRGPIMEIESGESTFREFLESAPDAMLIVDKGGIISRVNAQAEHLFGYKRDELLGERIETLIPERYREHHPSNREAYVADPKFRPMGQGLSLSALTKSGDEIPVEISLAYINSIKQPLVVAAIRDVTDRKQTETELRMHRDHLEDMVKERTQQVEAQAGRLEEALRRLGQALQKEKEFNELQKQFVSMASHEFRTPLSIIDSAAQRILRRAGQIEAEELTNRVGKIRSAVKRMTVLMDSTLSVSQLEAGGIELCLSECDLKSVIGEICERMEEIYKTHRIETDLSGLPDHIIADSKLLDNIFSNLISNAIKYSPDADRIEITGRRNRSTVTISFRDWGLGIGQQDLPRLFNRYFRAQTSTGIAGTGIGLTLSRRLAEMHGGDITVESAEGDGSTFTVCMPITGPESVENFVPSSSTSIAVAG